jgi:polyhydroxyalkanoate synthesis repressor PhaR
MELPPEAATRRRLIKRYTNRKLYDTEGSRYVTLLEIAELVRAGEEVEIIDNQTKEDKTEATLALIISEELKERPRGIPIATLKALIRHRGERLLTTLREGPIGRLIPREEPSAASDPAVTDAAVAMERRAEGTPPDGAAEPPDLAPPEVPAAEPERPSSSPSETPAAPSASLGSLRRTLEQWQAAVDERLRFVLPASADVEELKLQVRSLKERVEVLERRLSGEEKKPE